MWGAICEIHCLFYTVTIVSVAVCRSLDLLSMRDFAQIRTAEVDRVRGNWQRRALNAAFTGLRKTARRREYSKCSRNRETMIKKLEQT